MRKSAKTATVRKLSKAKKTHKTAGATYQLIRELGSGNYGTVWLAKCRSLSAQVAVKLLKPNRGGIEERLIKSLRREAMCLQRLEHPSIPRFIGCEFTSTSAYLAMEYVAGEDMDKWLTCKPPVSQRKRVLRAILSALHHAHGKLIVHLDLKNANVIVTKGPRAVVLDWGVAKTTLPEDDTDSPGHLGNLRNTPPECFNHYRKHNGRVFSYKPVQDIWSLGAIAYHILSGKHPFDVPGDLIKTQERIIHETPRLLPKKIGIWRDVVSRMLEKNPASRFQSCADILHVLDGKAPLVNNPVEIIEPLINDLSYELATSNELVVGRMAETNALGYYPDDCTISNIDHMAGSHEMSFSAVIHYSGDQDEDRPWCGDSIIVKLHGSAVWEDGTWSIAEHEIDRCDITS